MPNVFDRNAGFARGQAQVLGFSLATAIDEHSYSAPGSKIFYVDPNNAQAVDLGNLGEDPTVPLATVNAAVTLCRPYMGDTIYVAANEFWQYASRAFRPLPIIETLVIPYTKGGIRIVGCGTNPLSVCWTPAAANQACITNYATDVLIEGFNFYPAAFAGCTGIASYWTGGGLLRYGENLTVRNCYFETTLDYGIACDYTWYCQFYDNYFDGVNIAAIFNISNIGDIDFTTIHDNSFLNCTAAMTLTTSDGCFIYNNRIMGAHGGANNFIDLTGGVGNLVSDNYFSCTIAEYDTTCTAGAGDYWLNNHCINGSPVANPT